MKNICISFLITAIIILSGIGFYATSPKENTQYLRIHIRANSNELDEQNVKYRIKDAVIEYLTPFVAECETLNKAKTMLTEKLSAIESVCDKVLLKYGFNYTAKARVKNEEFPTRVYGSVKLDSGFYDALIIELGSGKGDNWWCVVYPPLCFTGEGVNYVYRSKILDIINGFLKKE